MDSRKIIRIHPIPEHFAVTWMLGALCNYDCMYCDNEWHDTTSRPHDLPTMQQAWRNIYEQGRTRGLPFKISFTGGEPTANKNLLPMIQWLRQNYSDIEWIGVTTNGSASLNYYKKLTKVVESITFSTHSEFMHESKFFEKVLTIDRMLVRPRKSLHVSIMNEFWNQERIKMYVEWLTENNISHSVDEINYSHRIREVPVNKGILDFEQIRKSS